MLMRTRTIDLLIAGLFLLLGFALYLSGLQAPWYFDDFRNIVENPLVRDSGKALRELFHPRGVAFFSFALNQEIGGMEPMGFRLVNILLHASAAILVWRILCRFFRTSVFLPVAGGLLFLAHPVQTQAVTYIVQRMAGMAGFFFLLAVYLYIRGREAAGDEGRGGICWQAGALFAFALALWTKQNTIVLPLVILALDYCILDRERFDFRASLLRTLPYLALALLAAVQLAVTDAQIIESLSAKAQVYTDLMTDGAGSSGAMPLRYFATELIVFWLYLKLLFFPVGQMLDYSWPVVASVWNWRSALALAGFVLLFVAGRGLRLWNRRVAFGVVWIVLTLAVESSFIPLDPVYEHRLYLPMFGVVVVALDLFAAWCPVRGQVPVLIGVLLVLAGLTVSRNALWADPVAFWRDNLAKAPTSSRVMSNLGMAYQSRGDYAAAAEILQQALLLTPADATITAGIGNALLHLGQRDEARSAFEQALRFDPDNALANSYLGTICVATGETERGTQLLQKAVTLAPGSSTYWQNFAVGLDLAGRRTEAEVAYRQGMARFPEHTSFLVGLGVLLDATGRPQEGLPFLARALGATPNDAKTLYYYGVVARHAGDQPGYRRALEGLRLLDQKLYEKLGQKVP